MKTRDLVKKYRHIFNTDYTQDANCQAAWLMDIDEDPLSDSSQNSNTAALKEAGKPAFATVSPPKAYTPGYYTWDGLSGYAYITPFVGSGAKFSYVAWINPVSTGEAGSGRIFQTRKDTSSRAAAWLVDASDGTTDLNSIIYRGAYESGTSNNDPITFGAWAHIAFTAETEQYVTMLVNGVEVTYVVRDWVNAPLSGDENNATIGNVSTGDTRTYDGAICELGFFDRVLDSTEINDILDKGLKGVVSNPFPVSSLRKDVITGYHCFMQGYMNAKVEGLDPLKLPDGTIF